MNFKKWVTDTGGQAALARRLGVTRQAVQLWVSGQATPSDKYVMRIEIMSLFEVSEFDIRRQCKARQRRPYVRTK